MVVTLSVQQYNNVGEKPTVVIILYAYINRHAGTPKAETNDTMSLVTGQFCYYIGSRIGWVSELQKKLLKEKSERI